MGALGILGLAAALSTDPAPTSRVQVNASSGVQYSERLGPYTYRTLQGFGLLGLTLYLPRPLVDDDAPYSLQSFLQRAGRVWLEVGGGGSEAGPTELHPFQRWGFAGVGFDLYVHPWIAINSSFAVRGGSGYDRMLVADSLFLQGTVGIGVRWEDVRVDVRYAIQGDRFAGTWNPVFYGNVLLAARAVFKRQLVLDLSIEVIGQGALTWGQLTGYLGRRLGVFAGAGGGQGAVYGGPGPVYNRAGAEVGISGWMSRHLGASLSYSLNWTASGFPTPAEGLTHFVVLTLSSRAP